MLSMGFIEDIEAILTATPTERQTALFSATLPPEIRRLAEKYMHDAKSVAIQAEQVTVEAIEQRYYLVNEADKTAALTRLFEIEEIDRALIFARTRVGTGELANELTGRGFPAEALNGDLSQEAREYTLNRFRQNKITVLVATDVAARGLDIDGITHVFNFDLPDDPEIYVHRIGRTGRAGKTGIAISLITPFERRNLRQLEAFTRRKVNRAELPTEAEILARREEHLLNQITVWLQRGRCRQERALVEKLAAQGHDVLDVAAVALKIARADEKQRPIAPVSEVLEAQPFRRERFARTPRTERFERRDRPERSERPEPRQRGAEHFPRQANLSHEQGMVRLNLNIGRKHGIRPNDIVGAIAAHARIPGSTIGKIYIEDQHTLVDVPEALVSQVMGNSHDLRIRQLEVSLKISQ
jgi:ATP-dependent RNA helicase DeaD